MAMITDDLAGKSPGKHAERRFFIWYTIVLAVIPLMGFAPEFYLRPVLPYSESAPYLDAALIVHGLLITVFTLAIPLQAWLISKGKYSLHMQLGNWFFGLGALIVPITYLAALTAYSHYVQGPSTVTNAATTAATLAFLPGFVLLLWVGWRRRRNAQLHKRLMILMACLLAAPGIFRLPLPLLQLLPQSAATVGFLLVVPALMIATTVPLWIWDRRQSGHAQSVTRWGTMLVAISVIAAYAVSLTPAWRAALPALPGFGPLPD